MPISQGLSSDKCNAVLGEAVARGLPVELQLLDEQCELKVAKTRLIAMDGEVLYLDAPEADLERIHIRRGQVCDASFCIDDNRYVFETEVITGKTLIRLNEQKSVLGLILRRPMSILHGQRRNHFRVSLVNEEAVVVSLHAADEDAETGAVSCPIAGPRFHARLVNLSAGGVSLLARASDVGDVLVGGRLFLALKLPGDESVYEMYCDVRQRRAISDGAAVRLGLRFKAWPDLRTLSRQQEHLQRHITILQRQQLKRAG